MRFWRWLTEGIFPKVSEYTGNRAEVAFVPGMCVVWDRSRLTQINVLAVKRAVALLKEGRVGKIVFSSNNDERTREVEGQLRLELAEQLGAEVSNIELLLQKNTTTHAEVGGLKEKYPGLRDVVAVAERWQMPRLCLALREAFPKAVIGQVAFKATWREHDFSKEPFGKSVTWGIRPLWILRNVGCYLLSPILLRGGR